MNYNMKQNQEIFVFGISTVQLFENALESTTMYPTSFEPALWLALTHWASFSCSLVIFLVFFWWY
jgi:hypothetical protein